MKQDAFISSQKWNILIFPMLSEIHFFHETVFMLPVAYYCLLQTIMVFILKRCICCLTTLF